MSQRIHCIRFGLFLLAGPGVASAMAQDGAGLYYFALEDLDNQRVLQRGTSEGTEVSLRRLNPPTHTRLRLWVLEAATLRVGSETFLTPGPARPFNIPTFALSDRNAHDADEDGLSDLAEFILGSDPFDRDTNGDGIPDGEAVRLGLDPTRGRAARTGIIDGAEVAGSLTGVTAYNDLAIVLVSRSRILLFNIFNRMTPLRVGEVVPPGLDWLEVDCTGTRVAVAGGGAGISVLDVSDPPNARVERTIAGLGLVNQVATAGRFVYAANTSREMILADLATGAVLGRRQYSPEIVTDLAVAGDHVYVLSTRPGSLADAVNNPGRQIIHKFAIGPALGDPVASLEVTGPEYVAQFADTYLFAGGGLLYVGGVGRLINGLVTLGFYAVRDEGNTLTSLGVPAPFTAYDVDLNGAGHAVFTQGYVSGGTGVALRRLGVADISEPDRPARFIASFDLPAFPIGYGSSLAIYNGLAYVVHVATSPGQATGAGLRVLNYMPVDLLRLPPRVTLETSAVEGTIVAGHQLRLTALATDDVQVRNVEFYLDGDRIATDGNFPFEHWFEAPPLTPERTSFTLRARASDTAGQATFSAPVVLRLVPLDDAP